MEFGVESEAESESDEEAILHCPKIDTLSRKMVKPLPIALNMTHNNLKD